MSTVGGSAKERVGTLSGSTCSCVCASAAVFLKQRGDVGLASVWMEAFETPMMSNADRILIPRLASSLPAQLAQPAVCPSSSLLATRSSSSEGDEEEH